MKPDKTPTEVTLDVPEALTPHQKMLHDHKEAKRRRREWHRDPRRLRRAKYSGNLY